MAQLDVDASNACIPPLTSPLSSLHPPLPTAVRGEPLILDGRPGRINSSRPVLAYGSGRLVVVRELWGDLGRTATPIPTPPGEGTDGECRGGTMRATQTDPNVKAFVYRGHTARVTAVKFSPSGCYVASGDAAGSVRVWSYDNEEHLCRLDLKRATTGAVRDLSWDADGKRICIVGESSGGASAASSDSAALCRVVQWDTAVSCGELGQHSRGRVRSCSFRQSRPMRIATGGDDGGVIFNGHTPFRRISGVTNAHDRPVNCVRYGPNDDVVASVGGDRRIRLYDGKSGECLGERADAHGAAIYSCAWSSDGRFLLTSSADGTAKLWRIAVASSAGGDGGATTIACEHTWDVADEQLEEVGGLDPSRQIVPAASSSSTFSKITTPVGGMLLGCAFVAGDVPVAVGYNGEINVLPRPACLLGAEAEADDATVRLTGHRGNVSALALDAASGRAYTGDSDGVVVGWDPPGGTGGSPRGQARQLRRAPGASDDDDDDDPDPAADLMGRVHRGAITSMVVTGSGSLLSVGWDDALRVASPAGGDGATPTYVRRDRLGAQPNAMAVGTDLAVIATVDGLVLVRDSHIVSGADSPIPTPYGATSVAVSRKDDVVCVGGEDGGIRVYRVVATTGGGEDAMGLEEVQVIRDGHQNKPVSSLAFRADGSLLASADSRDVCVWDADCGDWSPVVSRNRWCFHTQKITSLAWSPDGSVLASGGLDDSIFLWSTAKKMKRVQYKFAHRGGVVGLAFCSDDTLLSAGNDGCACRWNVGGDVAAKFG